MACIFIACPVKTPPHHKISLGNSAGPPTFIFAQPQYADASADKKLSPVQDVPQRPRVNEWREKNDAVFNTVSSLGRQKCCELSSMTRMRRKFLTLPNEG